MPSYLSSNQTTAVPDKPASSLSFPEGEGRVRGEGTFSCDGVFDENDSSGAKPSCLFGVTAFPPHSPTRSQISPAVSSGEASMNLTGRNGFKVASANLSS